MSEDDCSRSLSEALLDMSHVTKYERIILYMGIAGLLLCTNNEAHESTWKYTQIRQAKLSSQLALKTRIA